MYLTFDPLFIFYAISISHRRVMENKRKLKGNVHENACKILALSAHEKLV